MDGVLYLVATPIGNLEDITFRALRVLKEVNIIACEDTRRTKFLLDHYGISCKDTADKFRLVRYDEHVHNRVFPELVFALKNNQSVALVTNAGMPGVSDPGTRLVREAVSAGLKIVPVPGVSALCTAVAAFGYPFQRVEFVGFLPRSGSRKRRALAGLAGSEKIIVLFESPYRITGTLEMINELYGDTDVMLAREMTKLHEEFLRGKVTGVLEELRRRGQIKGEITLAFKTDAEKN